MQSKEGDVQRNTDTSRFYSVKKYPPRSLSLVQISKHFLRITFGLAFGRIRIYVELLNEREADSIEWKVEVKGYVFLARVESILETWRNNVVQH